MNTMQSFELLSDTHCEQISGGWPIALGGTGSYGTNNGYAVGVNTGSISITNLNGQYAGSTNFNATFQYNHF